MVKYSEEEKKSIEYLKEHINYFKDQMKFIEAIDCDYYDEEYEIYKNRIKQFETILNILEKQQKEIEKKDKQINKLSVIRQETQYGYKNIYLILEDRLVTIERNTYKIEVEEGNFVDVKELYNLYKDNIPKEAIRGLIRDKKLQLQQGVETTNDAMHLNGEIFALKELLGE